MKNYSKMSNPKINLVVAHALGAKVETSLNLKPCYRPDFEVSELSPGGPVDKFDPCNSWADAGPIIEANNISLRKRFEGDWLAENEWGVSFRSRHENARRAAMIVFLMMHEAKNE